MPTNLPPDYFEVEKRFREAESTAEKIALLEEMLSIIPKHKGTDHLRAEHRRRLSKLKEEAQQRKSGGRHESSFHIDREGAGQIVIVGCTNVGKSALLRALTRAEPEVSAAPYTTWQPMPGMMTYEGVPIQLIDTPPLDREFVEPALMDLARRVDMVLLVVDIQAEPFEQLQEALKTLDEHRIVPLHCQEGYAADTRRLAFVPMLVLVNKCDDENSVKDYRVFRELLEQQHPMLAISVSQERNLDILQKTIFEQLGVIRVFSKAPGKDPDLSVPFVLKKGTTVEGLAGRIHKDILKNLKSARVWGSGIFEGQMVARDYVLQDGDVVELKV